jgi:hypothetical protein
MRTRRISKVSVIARALAFAFIVIGCESGCGSGCVITENEAGVAVGEKQRGSSSLLDGLAEEIVRRIPLEVAFYRQVIDYEEDWRTSVLMQELVKVICRSVDVDEESAAITPVFLSMSFRYPPEAFPTEEPEGLIEIGNPPSSGCTESPQQRQASRAPQDDAAADSTTLFARFRDDMISSPRCDIVAIARIVISRDAEADQTHEAVRTVLLSYCYEEERWTPCDTSVHD